MSSSLDDDEKVGAVRHRRISGTNPLEACDCFMAVMVDPKQKVVEIIMITHKLQSYSY